MKLKITGDNLKVSDGYHTIDELYEHRFKLFLALCSMLHSCVSWFPDHYAGWDVVYIDLPDEGQISYHLPVKYRPNYQSYRMLHKNIWDGHSSNDVLSRLESFYS